MDRPGEKSGFLLRRIVLLLPFFLTVFTTEVLSQTDCIELAQPGPDRLFASPGQVVTAGLTATNRSSRTRAFVSQSLLPPGWRRITPDAGFDLAPGASNVLLVSFVIPAGASTGPYQIRFTVQDSGQSDCRAEQLVVVFVKPTHGLALEIVDAPRFVISGRPDSVAYSVKNNGNEPARVRISTWTTQGLVTTPASFITILGIGESRVLSVRLASEGEPSGPSTHILRLRAQWLDDTTVEANASAQFQSIAGGMLAEKRYHEAPLQVTVRGAGEGNRTGGQIELSGAGTLTEGGKERYELFVRTPDIQSSSLLATRDEYRIGYSSERYEAVLGDRSYSLSPLTELGRYAFGAGGKASIGDFSVGGFLNRTRFYSPSMSEQALFGGYAIDDRSTISMNYLHKAGRDESSTGTLRALLQPFARNNVDVEYGLSSREGAADRAFAVHLVGSQDWIAYDLRYIHAGPEYGGYYSDLDSRSISLNLRPWELFRVEAYAREEKRNLLFDSSALTVAPLDRFYQFGGGYGEMLSVYYRAIEQIDRFSTSSYNRKEESVQLRSGFSGRSTGFSAIVEFGRSLDRLLSRSSPFQRYTVSANVQPIPRQNFSASLEYTSERNLLTWDISERWSGSFSASLEIGESTQIQAGVFGTRTGGISAETFATADAAIVHTFPFHHSAGFRVRRTYVLPGNEERDLSWLLEYTIPLQIPVSRLTTTGDIRGRVLDAALMRGVPEVVVYAGSRAAITNEYGEYAFAGLNPGPYQMRLDPSAIGFDRVTTAPMPATVSVPGGGEAQFDIYIVGGAAVSGSVRVFEFSRAGKPDSSAPSYVDSLGVSNTLVELSSATDTLRRITDNRGMFRFPLVRPGDWTLRILDLQEPENHTLEKDSLHLTLPSGAHQETLFRLIPRVRRIRILQEGKVEVERAPSIQRPLMKPRRFGTCIISEDSTGQGYLVQVSTWKTVPQALEAADLIRRITGLKAVVRTLPAGLNAVVLGPFKTLPEAEDACREVGK